MVPESHKRHNGAILRWSLSEEIFQPSTELVQPGVFTVNY